MVFIGFIFGFLICFVLLTIFKKKKKKKEQIVIDNNAVKDNTEK